MLYAVIGCGALAVVYGIITRSQVLGASAGTERMQEISAAVQQGAAAYLRRQYMTIAGVGAIVIVILYFVLGWQVARRFRWEPELGMDRPLLGVGVDECL